MNQDIQVEQLGALDKIGEDHRLSEVGFCSGLIRAIHEMFCGGVHKRNDGDLLVHSVLSGEVDNLPRLFVRKIQQQQERRSFITLTTKTSLKIETVLDHPDRIYEA